MSSGRLFNVREAAENTGVSVQTMYRWIDKGYIQAFKIPSNKLRIREAHLEELKLRLSGEAPDQKAE